jgi:hypothetical protein
MSWVKSLRTTLLAFGVSAFAACGLTDASGGDSNTHWLQSCTEDDDCGGQLSCLCGVCSEPCTADRDCQHLGNPASCGEPADCDAPAGPLCIRTSGAGGGGPGPDDPCRALDAATGLSNCGSIVGYTWNGQQCDRVYCSCQGSECDRMYLSAEECDRAHTACYAERGVTRQCETHADCVLDSRTCCAPCGMPEADQLMATQTDSVRLAEAGSCLGVPGGTCPACATDQSPVVYPACIDGECGVLNLADLARCDSDEDCRVSTKDCCECNSDMGPSGVIGVNLSFTSPPYCDSPSCDECQAPSTDAIATCNLVLNWCEVAFP